MFPFFPLGDVLNAGFNLGRTIGNNILTGQPVTRNLATVLANPDRQIIINNPAPAPKPFFGGDFKIGFVEKNVIIVGVLGLAAFTIYSFINKKS